MKSLYLAVLCMLALTLPARATVTVTTPTPGATVSSPVHYVASASTTTCGKGVASMGIYVNNVKVYVVKGTKLDYQLSLSPGYQHTVVEEWDYCGGASTSTINLTVSGSANTPTVSIHASPTSISAGSSSTLTVTASGATSVAITGNDGSTYSLPATGGTQVVDPTATTTYTAEAQGSGGTATATTTVTVGSAGGTKPINHVIFMLQENHSFDNYFGMLNPYRRSHGWNVGDDGRDYEVDGIDDKLNISNADDEGVSFPLFKLKSTCVDDETSSWLESYGDVNRYNFLTSRPIKMDGFVHTAEGFSTRCNNGTSSCNGSFTDTTGRRAMGYYDENFLNYYYYMASQFAVSDRWFSPMSTKSIPNRIATFSGGTTQGLVFDPGSNDHLHGLTIPTIFQELQNAGVSWKIYYSGRNGLPDTSFSYFTYAYQYLYSNPTHAACSSTTQPSSVVGDSTNSFCINTNHIAPLSTYYSDLSNGKLPSFAFIETAPGLDEHPGSGISVLTGQAQVASIINAFMASPSWSDSVFFLSYDEGGGPYDHVPPVKGHSNDKTSSGLGSIPDISSIAVNPDGYGPCVPSGGVPTTHCDLNASNPGAHSGDAAAVYGFSAQLGFRTPNLIISPFTRRHYVSHTPMDHTAIIKFVENRFIGPSAHLTARDAAQPNLEEFFDFNGTPWATPPSPPKPVTSSSLGYNPCTPSNMGP